ncbi:MAG TPA: DUF1464 family protein [Ktedonobacteraceae bacterium]|nr:DUF1464 family protein [Ktedonobacteraceae bacterium]
MTVSVGVDYAAGSWRVCCVDQGKLIEFHEFSTVNDLLAWIHGSCPLYPEPTMVLSLDVTAPFSALPALTSEQVDRLLQRYRPLPAFTEVSAVLQILRSISVRSYCAPSVEYLPTVPLHRRLLRPGLGTANEVCAVVALLRHLREQEASWPEMSFLYVNAGVGGVCALVIQDGQIVNGIGTLQGTSLPLAYRYLAMLETAQGEQDDARHEALQKALHEAFWEGLTQELAGLLATHHIEDMVVLGQESARLIERLADSYQIYLFPQASSEHEGYEAALGAALLAEGLELGGSAADVVNHLQIRQAEQVALISRP